jgi:hypothetical protein
MAFRAGSPHRRRSVRVSPAAARRRPHDSGRRRIARHLILVRKDIDTYASQQMVLLAGRDLHSREALELIQVQPRQVRPAQIRAREIRHSKRCVGEIRSPQRAVDEQRAFELGTGEIAVDDLER